MKLARLLVSFAFLSCLTVAFLGGSVGIALLRREAASLPSLDGLTSHRASSTSRMLDGEGREVGKFAEQNRMPVSLSSVPPLLVSAFISAEDRNYRRHHGVDPGAVLRAALVNFRGRGSGRRPVGASTITQQVAKNMLVGDGLTLRRKVREVLIALRMDRELGKDRVLELYLNEIYLGEGAYGVAAASDAWFGKPMSSLGIADVAFLAGMPKAPSAYDPVRRPDAARARRAYVLGRMADDGVITRVQADDAAGSPLPQPPGGKLGSVATGWFPEAARREVVAQFGAPALYRNGLLVKTSLNPRMQSAVEMALRNGLVAYDRRHGWRGSQSSLSNIRSDRPDTWAEPLARMDMPMGAGSWQQGVVLGVDKSGAAIVGFADKSWGTLPLDGVRWARRAGDRGMGPVPRRVDEVVRVGDIVLVSVEGGRLELRQVPEVQGSAVVMENATGRILAVAGGLDATLGGFDRATQARRQPGSTFKTLIYLAAFEAGYDPTSPVLDSPIALDSGPGQRWRPDGGNAMGLITVRRALEASRNLASVRLLNEVGLEQVSAMAMRLGVYDKPLSNFAAALGAVETTNLRLTAAYAMVANGGLRITPRFVDSIEEGGRVIWSRPPPGERVLSPLVAAQTVSVLEGVIRKGTAAATLGKIPLAIAGKTGTTNEDHDAWFVGMTPTLAIGVHVGYDRPEDMGSTETGGMAAAPIFGEIAQSAATLLGATTSFPLPPGTRAVRVDPATGEESRTGILEVMPVPTTPAVSR